MALLEYESAHAIFDTFINKLRVAANDKDSELRRFFLAVVKLFTGA